MSNITVTIDDILKLRPCSRWTRDRMEAITDKREMDLLDVLTLSAVPVDDRIWLAIKHLPEMEQRKFAIWCARRCKTDVPEITAYIDAIDAYYISQTGTLDQMTAADSAAYWATDKNATKAADEVAYWAANGAAAKTTNKAAYWAAAEAADWGAYMDADREAYRAAKRQAQLRKLRAMIKQQEGGAA
jgi:hypothetical protein